jgi:signal transduction histidine kinase
MMPWNSQSISGKLMRMTLLVSGTALFLAYVSFLAYDLYSLRQELVTSLETEANLIGANSVTALLFDDQQAAEATLSALNNSKQVRSALIVHNDGRPFASYVRDPDGRMAIDERLAPGESHRYWAKGRDILLGNAIFFQGKSVGSVYLLAETSDVARRAERFGLISACMLIICFALALLATSTIRHLVTDPLTGLAKTAQIVSRQRDYSVRAKLPNSSDELAFLVQSFNEMLEQIQARDRALEESRTVLEQRVEERTAELSATNRELEAFSYSVAHDLRGPLQHINNIGYLLQHFHAGSLDPEGSALVDKMLEGSNRMSLLIDDLLNLSRASSHPLHRTPIDLSHMAESIVTRLEAEKNGRRVSFSVARGAQVIADEGLLQVVLDNLLSNSWKYTSKVDSAEIEFGFHDEESRTVFFVRDNGVGFNPRYADRLFRPFQRLHSQSDFPGTGVGLATAYRIITRHGGKIWAKGSVDQGATFFFTLPYDITE